MPKRYDYTYYEKHFTEKFELLFKHHYDMDLYRNRQVFVIDYDLHFNQNGDKSIKNTCDTWFAKRKKNLDNKKNTVPDLDTLCNICSLMDCDIDYFLTPQTDYDKNIATVSDVTGLQYNTVEVLQQCNTANQVPHEDNNYIGRQLIYIIDFLLLRPRCRYLLHNLYCYWFKHFNSVLDQNGLGGGTTVQFSDSSGISFRNIGFEVGITVESILYSFILQSILKIKENEEITEPIEPYENTPTKAQYNKMLKEYDNDIKEIESSSKSYKERFSITPKYACQLAFRDGVHFGLDNPTPQEILQYIKDNDYGTILTEKAMERVKLDMYNNQRIEQIKQQKEQLEYEMFKLGYIKSLT